MLGHHLDFGPVIKMKFRNPILGLPAFWEPNGLKRAQEVRGWARPTWTGSHLEPKSEKHFKGTLKNTFFGISFFGSKWNSELSGLGFKRESSEVPI